MVINRARSIFVILALIFLQAFQGVSAQNAFTSIHLSRTKVYPKEPFKVTIVVYTETWFTQPLEFDNIQVPNAFVVPFKRTQPKMTTINNKKYASLEFYYQVYPYQAGEYQIPPINVIATTPKVGDYKGRKITLTTKPKSFTVRAIPNDFKGEEWFIAKSVTLSQSWNKNLDNLKVGDVVERTITINANGTLPNFIPELEFEEIGFGSIYPQPAKLTDRKNVRDANGTRTEKALYLFEKERDFELPEIRVDWWNPYRQQAYFSTLEPVKLTVKHNDQLGIVLSVKDSLNLNTGIKKGGKVENKEAWMPFGLKPWQFFSFLFLAVLSLYYLIKWGSKIVTRLRYKRQLYKISESYFFKKVILAKVSDIEKINNLYTWWDSLRRQSHAIPSLTEAIDAFKNKELIAQWAAINVHVFKNENSRSFNVSNKTLLKFRHFTINRYTKEIKGVSKQQKWIEE